MTNKKFFFQYYGGKFYQADTLISLFPKHGCYVDVFGGAGNILLNKPLSSIEVFNDINSDIFNLFEQVRDNSENFLRQLKLIPNSREQFDIFASEINTETDKLKRAIMYYTLANQGNIYRFYPEWGSGKHPAITSRQFKNRVEKLEEVISRLQGVYLENKDFEFVLKNMIKTQHFFI